MIEALGLEGDALACVLARLDRHLSLAPADRECARWEAHRDINDVMLATSLVPDGYLEA